MLNASAFCSSPLMKQSKGKRHARLQINVNKSLSDLCCILITQSVMQTKRNKIPE